MAVTLVLLGTAGCAPEEEPPVALEVLREGVEMAALDAEIHMTREGIRRMRLLADTAEFFGGGEVRLHGMEMTFFEQDGTEVSHITADGGTYQENTDDMEAEGSVVVLDRREEQRLETTRLRYVAEEDRLYGDEPFVLYKDGGQTEIRGSSFESDPEMTEVVTYNSSGQSRRLAAPAPPPAEARGDTTPEPAAGDSARTDTLGTPGDSTVGPPDSTVVPPDSTGAPPDTMRSGRRR